MRANGGTATRLGANALWETLRAGGVEACFANPGTSEMHLVAALDDDPGVRPILVLAEPVATGAADGFARVTGRAGAALVHLGPGLANGWSNLHNARRAHSPVLAVVGDFPDRHRALDPLLASDLDGLAASVGGWYRRAVSGATLGADAADALRAAYGPPGRPVVLAIASDAAGRPCDEPVVTVAPPAARPVATAAVEAAAHASGPRTALLLGGAALTRRGLELAARVGAAGATRLFMEPFPAIVDHGAGATTLERVNYIPEFAQAQLAEVDELVLVGAREPVGPFDYEGVAGRLVREDARITTLAAPDEDVLGALEALVERLGAPPVGFAPLAPPAAPTGPLTPESLCAAVGATLDEGTVVVDESITSGLHLFEATSASPAHRITTLTGHALGYGLPCALGAAVGSAGRVLALVADGSFCYSAPALWSMAREGLDVTVVVLVNRRYAILEWERHRLGAMVAGSPSASLMDLSRPDLDYVALAHGFGVPATRATTAEALVERLGTATAESGPHLVEAEFAPR